MKQKMSSFIQLLRQLRCEQLTKLLFSFPLRISQRSKAKRAAEISTCARKVFPCHSAITGNIVIALCTLNINVNSLCRKKVFKQTAESVNDVVSFMCPDKTKNI